MEIEIKVKIERSQTLISFLKTKGSFVSEETEVDQYFTPSHRDFTSVNPINEWLRVRTSKGKASINYKNWYLSEEGKQLGYCEENESEISAPDQVFALMKALDFKTLTTVTKKRSKWNFQDYEVSIDEVEDLGVFVEVEYKGKNTDGDPLIILQEMVDFLKGLNLGKIERNQQGYPFLLMFPERAKFQEV